MARLEGVPCASSLFSKIIFFCEGSRVHAPAEVGTGQIWLDNMECLGNETRLIDCPSSLLGSHDCVHAEDVGISCVDTGKSSANA